MNDKISHSLEHLGAQHSSLVLSSFVVHLKTTGGISEMRSAASVLCFDLGATSPVCFVCLFLPRLMASEMFLWCAFALASARLCWKQL